ncbi:MAG TPA: hypothetical protein VHF22_12575 [Planctomycetota bacterium]|nr:hypothetical protein [Planctomycetota bacterium]
MRRAILGLVLLSILAAGCRGPASRADFDLASDRPGVWGVHVGDADSGPLRKLKIRQFKPAYLLMIVLPPLALFLLTANIDEYPEQRPPVGELGDLADLFPAAEGAHVFRLRTRDGSRILFSTDGKWDTTFQAIAIDGAGDGLEAREVAGVTARGVLRRTQRSGVFVYEVLDAGATARRRAAVLLAPDDLVARKTLGGALLAPEASGARIFAAIPAELDRAARETRPFAETLELLDEVAGLAQAGSPEAKALAPRCKAVMEARRADWTRELAPLEKEALLPLLGKLARHSPELARAIGAAHIDALAAAGLSFAAAASEGWLGPQYGGGDPARRLAAGPAFYPELVIAKQDWQTRQCLALERSIFAEGAAAPGLGRVTVEVVEREEELAARVEDLGIDRRPNPAYPAWCKEDKRIVDRLAALEKVMAANKDYTYGERVLVAHGRTRTDYYDQNGNYRGSEGGWDSSGASDVYQTVTRVDEAKREAFQRAQLEANGLIAARARNPRPPQTLEAPRRRQTWTGRLVRRVTLAGAATAAFEVEVKGADLGALQDDLDGRRSLTHDQALSELRTRASHATADRILRELDAFSLAVPGCLAKHLAAIADPARRALEERCARKWLGG